MILVVLSTHADLASATARGARIGKRANYIHRMWQKLHSFTSFTPDNMKISLHHSWWGTEHVGCSIIRPNTFRPMSFCPKTICPTFFRPHDFCPCTIVLYDLCPKIFRPQCFGPQIFSPNRFRPKNMLSKYFLSIPSFVHTIFVYRYSIPSLFVMQYFVHTILVQRYFVPLVFVLQVFSPNTVGTITFWSMIHFVWLISILV